MLIATFIIIVIALIGLTFLFLKTSTWKPFMLSTTIDSKVNENPNELAVGQKGKTLSRLAPMGKAKFGNTIVEVTSIQDFIDEGSEVSIVKIEQNKIIVNK